MCLVERVFVPSMLLKSFIKACNFDIRKTILHLHFWFDRGQDPLFKDWQKTDVTEGPKDSNVKCLEENMSQIHPNCESFSSSRNQSSRENQENTTNHASNHSHFSKCTTLSELHCQSNDSNQNNFSSKVKTRSVLTAKCAKLKSYPNHCKHKLFKNHQVCN